MHALMVANALAACPGHTKRFDIYTNASDFQLDAGIVQDRRPVAYFSFKMSSLLTVGKLSLKKQTPKVYESGNPV